MQSSRPTDWPELRTPSPARVAQTDPPLGRELRAKTLRTGRAANPLSCRRSKAGSVHLALLATRSHTPRSPAVEGTSSCLCILQVGRTWSLVFGFFHHCVGNVSRAGQRRSRGPKDLEAWNLVSLVGFQPGCPEARERYTSSLSTVNVLFGLVSFRRTCVVQARRESYLLNTCSPERH